MKSISGNTLQEANDLLSPKKINTNPDQTVDFTTGGKTEKLSKEEYENMLKGQQKYPELSPESQARVQKLKDLDQRAYLAKRADEALKKGANITDIYNLLVQAEAERTGQANPQPESLLDEQIKQQLTPQKNPSDYYAENSIPNKITQAIGIKEPQMKAGKVAEQMLIKPVAQVWDFVQSLWSEGKGVEQKQAEMAFTDIKTSINSQLSLVDTGIIDVDEVRRLIYRAESVNNKLEEVTKSWSERGIRYYLTDGLDVQEQVIVNRITIENWKKQLVLAETKRQLAEAQASYGLK